LSYSFISTSIYNSVHHTCEYNQLQNRSNHFDTPGTYLTQTSLRTQATGKAKSQVEAHFYRCMSDVHIS